MKKGRITLILLLILIMTIVHYRSSSMVSKPVASITGTTEYEQHDTIKIFNDNDFASYGFEGLGTPDEPYLIDGYNITDSTTDLIRIEDTVVYFKISNCYLNDLSSSFYSIELVNVTHGIIDSNIICNPSYGIRLASSNSNTLSSNTIYNCVGAGIDLWLSNHSTLSSNTIYNCTYYGIRLSSSSSNTLSSNTIYKCVDGIDLAFSSNNNILSSNTIYSCSKSGIDLTPSSNNNILSSNTISNCSSFGIYLGHSSNYNILSSNTISNCSNGINSWYSNYSTLSSNTISNCSTSGIYLGYSNHSSLSSNTIFNCTNYGIWVSHSNRSTLSSNTISNCSDDGIYLWLSNHSTLSSNTISQCSDNGIYLSESHHNTLSSNTIFNCTNNGIETYPSNNNTLIYNTIYNNSQYGFSFSSSSNDNIANWNNLFDNYVGGTSQAYDAGAANNISYNYWDEWTTPDVVEPYGIVDRSYSIAGSATNDDPSPLTIPEPPLVTIVTPLEQGYSTDTIAVRLSGNAIHYWYYIEGKDIVNQTWRTRKERTLDVDGTYTLHAYGKILSMKVLNSTNTITHVSITFTIDTTPPAVFIDSPIDTTYETDTFIVDLSGGVDVAHYWYYIEGFYADNQTWTDPILWTLADGAYILHAYANDTVGNTASVLIAFKIDIMAPTITLESPQNDTAHNSETIIKVDVIDVSLDTVLYNWDGITNKTWNGDYETSLPTIETKHVLYVYANDSFGRWASEVFVFTTDDTNPTVDITSPNKITYDQNSVTLAYTVSDGTVTIYINGVTNTTALPSGTIISNLPDGFYNITITAVDQAGNIGTDTFIFAVEIVKEESSETSSKAEPSADVGSFPGLFTVLLFLVCVVVFLRRHKY